MPGVRSVNNYHGRPPLDDARVWQLHSQGVSHAAIATRMEYSTRRIEASLRRTRAVLAANVRSADSSSTDASSTS